MKIIHSKHMGFRDKNLKSFFICSLHNEKQSFHNGKHLILFTSML